jgi:hypothetical protein
MRNTMPRPAGMDRPHSSMPDLLSSGFGFLSKAWPVVDGKSGMVARGRFGDPVGH